MKRSRITRRSVSQRTYAKIERDLAAEVEAKQKKHGVTIDAPAAAKAVEDGRCPFEMARAANASLRSA